MEVTRVSGTVDVKELWSLPQIVLRSIVIELFAINVFAFAAMNFQVWKQSLRAVSGSLGVITAVAWVGETTQEPNVSRTEAAAVDLSSHSLADFGPYPPIRVMRPNENLEIAFDVRTRNPVYVLERLVISAGGKLNRPNFYEDKTLPAAYRSQLQHFHKSGYDRGHMAPAADYDYDRNAYNDTFSLVNICPQDPILNKKDWANLEDWVRNTAKKADKELGATTYVVTGPMWLPKRQIGDKTFQYVYPALGKPPSLVSVPSHFFKIVAVVKDKQIIKFACFVMSNTEPEHGRNLQDYLVRWTDLEAVTGLQFFPNLVDDAWKLKADQLTGNFLKGSPQVLLLTDGSSGSSSSLSWKSQRGGRTVAQHLCDRNACRKS